MAKDFKQSYAQKEWEFALSRHARASRMIEMISRNPGLEKTLAYWTEAKSDAEEKFPCLKNAA